jgi:ATP-binding cassette subfamily B protein
MPTAMFFNSYATAWVIAEVINKLTSSHIPADQLWSTFTPWIIAYIVSIGLGELVLWRLVIFLIWKLEAQVVYGLNQRGFDTLAQQSMDFHNSRFGGSLVSQVNKFSKAYVTLMDVLIYNMIPLVASFVFTFAILGPKLPLFALGLAALAAVFMLIAIFSFRNVRALNVAEADSQNVLSGQLADSVANIMAIKSHGSEQMERDRYGELNRRSQTASLNVMGAVMKRDIGFGTVILVISGFAFLMLIGGQAWFGVGIGTLVLAITYTSQILGQLWGFNGILRNTYRAFGDAQEMTRILNQSKSVVDTPDASQLRVIRGRITFNDITYHYSDDPSGEPLFKNFSLEIDPGQRIGLVGPSGSGKTTLTKLLLRFADVDNGSIMIDGQNIARVTQESLRKHIAYVPQEPMLFHRTIRDNIAYARPHATDEEVERAAKQANALEFIERLPEGFHTMVGERGVKLSGGQRQRIAIARAVLKNAPILVFDEATSALDSESEKYIQAALANLMQGRTSIVVAHRLSTIAELDRIVVLDNGRIREQGTHKELLKNKGIYATLWAHQSGGFIEP